MTVPLGRPRRITARRATSGSTRAWRAGRPLRSCPRNPLHPW